MSQETYHEAMAQVFEDEGGYSNHPSDPGGPTNWGITIIDARMYWKHDATAADVRSMPKGVAEDIYAKHYAAPIRYDDLPPGVDYSVLDYTINSGIGRAPKVLQRIVGVPADGLIGNITLHATIAADSVHVIDAIWDERLAFLHALRTWDVFGHGWAARCRTGRALALRLAAKYPKHELPPPPMTAAAPDAPPEVVARSAKALEVRT